MLQGRNDQSKSALAVESTDHIVYGIYLWRRLPKVTPEQAPKTIKAHYRCTYTYLCAGISIILSYYVR